jgi:hypothetical protein
VGKLSNLSKAFEKFDPDAVLNKVLKIKEVDTYIKTLIQDRLWQLGEDAKGKKIRTYSAIEQGEPAYSYNTVFGTKKYRGKKAKGQPSDRVTLKDTGKFYKSWQLQLLKELFYVQSMTEKADGNIEDNVNLANVITLSEDEKKYLVDKIRPFYIQEARKVIGL